MACTACSARTLQYFIRATAGVDIRLPVTSSAARRNAYLRHRRFSTGPPFRLDHASTRQHQLETTAPPDDAFIPFDLTPKCGSEKDSNIREGEQRWPASQAARPLDDLFSRLELLDHQHEASPMGVEGAEGEVVSEEPVVPAIEVHDEAIDAFAQRAPSSTEAVDGLPITEPPSDAESTLQNSKPAQRLATGRAPRQDGKWAKRKERREATTKAVPLDAARAEKMPEPAVIVNATEKETVIASEELQVEVSGVPKDASLKQKKERHTKTGRKVQRETKTKAVSTESAQTTDEATEHGDNVSAMEHRAMTSRSEPDTQVSDATKGVEQAKDTENKAKATSKVQKEAGASSKSPADPPKKAKKEPWQIQKAALDKKFGEQGWAPRKRLSPDAIEGVKAMHAQFPDKFTTPVLAEHFKMSPEAIRRILKTKWAPSEEDMEKRRKRWQNRGERIWTNMVEMGTKPPKKWREMGVGKADTPGLPPKWKRNGKITGKAKNFEEAVPWDSSPMGMEGSVARPPPSLADRIV